LDKRKNKNQKRSAFKHSQTTIPQSDGEHKTKAVLKDKVKKNTNERWEFKDQKKNRVQPEKDKIQDKNQKDRNRNDELNTSEKFANNNKTDHEQQNKNKVIDIYTIS